MERGVFEDEEVVSGFEAPVGVTNAGDGSGRLFLVEKTGRIRVIQDGQLLEVDGNAGTVRVVAVPMGVRSKNVRRRLVRWRNTRTRRSRMTSDSK